MICGTISFISCLAAFVYPVMAGHPENALVVIWSATSSLPLSQGVDTGMRFKRSLVCEFVSFARSDTAGTGATCSFVILRA
jgi:hypothetical protein